MILICLSLPWFIGSTLFRIVDGASMEPTLRPGTVVAMIPASMYGALDRGDIAVMTTGWEADLTVIKRVAGLPGDCVSQVATKPGSLKNPCVLVRADHLYVLGDNPSRSSDSRQNGQVPAGAILGVVKCVVWPLRAIRCGRFVSRGLPEVR